MKHAVALFFQKTGIASENPEQGIAKPRLIQTAFRQPAIKGRQS